MNDNTINLHITANERKKWNRCIADVAGIINGSIELPPGNGSRRGSSMNDFTNEYKKKLDSVAWNANNYVHPPTHPASMITGLARVATSGDYNHLINRPTKMVADGGNCDTIDGCRWVISRTAPSNPQVDRIAWINPNDRLIRIFTPQGWQALYAVWA